MNWPTSQDYNEAVQDPETSFSDPALQGGQVVVNALGLPVPRSGNFADVYQFTGADGKAWALKCFTRKVAGLRERYARIDEHLAGAKLPFTVGFKFFEKGIRVRGEWFPLLKMEWVEGFTLNDFVARNLGKPDLLHRLTQMWAKLAGRLRDANMAHADLQHGNVLLVPGATPQKLGLKLIDYDGMWVPALAGTHSGEVGHPNFQHPVRLKEKLYSGDVDRFPHLVIAAGLRAALVGGKPVWDKFDNEDNLLFKEADFRNPAAAPVFKALWELNDPVLRTLVGHITLSASQPLRKTPWLDEVLLGEGGPKLSADEERRVCEVLGVTTAAPTGTKAAPPAAVEQEFNVFQFLDEDEGPKSSASAISGRRTIPKRRVPQQKSKAPLFIGAGAAAAVLLIGGVVAAVALSNNKKDRPTEVVERKDKDKGEGPKPPVTPKVDERTIKAAAGSVNTKDDLRQILADTKWDWGDGILELRADGSVFHTGWSRNPGLVKRWEPLDRRTVLMIVEAGRDHNRYSLLELSEDLTRFTGFDFISVNRMPDKKRVSPLARPDFRPPTGTPTEDAKQELRQSLAGSEWEWDGGRLRLNDDGSAVFPQGPDRVAWAARWEPVDRRTAVVVIPKGKATDRLAVLQFSEDVKELTGYDFAGAAKLPTRKRLEGTPPPSGGPRGLVAGIAALPGGRDFLFVRQNDPVLYATVNGLARRPREVGRSVSSIRTVAVTPDGSKAVTGGEDGTVGIWTLKGEPGTPAAAGDPQMKTRIASFKKIDTFNGRWSFDAYQEGIVVHDFERKLDATIPVGEPGHPVKGAFAGNLKNNAKLSEQLGQAVTDEINLYAGDLIVQVFEGGVQLYSKTVDKSWFGWHARRKPAADGGPGAAPQRADYVWVDDALPPGARPSLTDPGAADWEFIGAADGPVHSGQKSVKIVASGTRQNVFAGARPALRIGAGDVLFAYVYLDPKNPPEEIMLQWAGHGWQRGGFRRAYWGANKLQWARDGSPALKSMGPLPEAGKWVRLEVKIDDLDIQPGAAISSLALTQFGGTAYWDAIGVNTATMQDTATDAPANGAKMVKEHTSPVVACAVSPDGSRAVTVGLDRQLCEWDLAGAKLVRKFEVPDARAVAYLPDGKSVLIGTEGESAAVWDLETKTRTKEVAGHTRPVRAVYVSPRGDMAWTASEDGEIRNWAVPEFRQLGAFSNEQKPIAALAVSDDGQVLAAAGLDGWVRYFNGRTGRSLGGGGGRLSILAVAILPGGTKVAAAWGLEPVVADLPRPREAGNVPTPPPSAPATGSSVLKLVQEADAPGGRVIHMGYSPDGKHLWLARQDSLTVADGATGKEINSWHVEATIWGAAFGPGKQLYLVTNSRFQAWDWEKGKLLHDFDPIATEAPRPVACWAGGGPNRLIVATTTPSLLVWNTTTWKEVGRLTPYPNEPLGSIAPYPDGRRFAALVGRELRPVVWDVVGRREAFRLTDVDGKSLYRLEVAPGGRWVVGLSREGGGRVVVWNGRTGKLVHTIAGVQTASFAGGFSPGGDHYLYCEYEAKKWDVDLAAGRLTEESGGQKPSGAVAAAPAAGLFATVDSDHRLRVWRFDVDAKPAETARTPDPTPMPPTPPAPTEAGGLVKELDLPDPVTACAVSADGKKAYIGTRKGTIHVVDATTGQEVGKPFELSKARIIHMVFVVKYIHPSNGAAIPDRLHVLDDDRHLIAVDVDKGTKVRDVDLSKANVPALSATSRLAITPFESHVMVFDAEQSKAYSWASGRWSQASIPAALHNPPFNESTRAVAYAPDGSVGAAVAARKLLVWKSRGTKETKTFEVPFFPRWVGVAADAGAVAASDGGRLAAWKIESGGEALSVRDPHGVLGTFAIAATPGGLVTAGADRWLRVWDLKAGKEAMRWRLERTPAGVAASADGRRAVVWDEEGNMVGVWALPESKGK